MIVVTRLNGSQFAVNPDLIERIHAQPDTTLIMVDNAKYIITETMTEVIEMIASYRAYIVSLARDMPTDIPLHGIPPLGLVPRDDLDEEENSSINTSATDNTVALWPRKK